MSCLTATLQPNTRALGNRPRGEAHAIITPDFHHAGCSLGTRRLYQPAVFPQVTAHTTCDVNLREELPCVLEHVQVGSSPVPSGANDEVNVQILFLHQGAICHAGEREKGDLEAKPVALVLGTDKLAPGQNTVWPLLLFRSKCPLLVVHGLEEVFDQLEADDAVVGGSRIGQEVCTVV